MKRIIAIIMALTLCLSFTACSSVSEEKPSENVNDVEQNAEENSIIVIDQAGREVKLDKSAETIVSAYYITSYATIALGISDKLIGIEKKAETRPIYTLSAEHLLEIEQVGSLKEFNIEAVAELSPELVLMPIALLEQANTLTELGITVLVVNPETREGLNEMILNIGLLTGSVERANDLINAQDEIYDTIDNLVQNKETARVYMGSNSSHVETAAALMYQNSLITHAGGENVFSDIEDTYWTPVSYEAILEKNPDYFIIPPGATYTINDVLNDVALQDINAVKNKNVFKMPEGYEEIDSPVPSGVLGVYWLAVTLHGTPEDIAIYEETFSEFYKEFYGFE